MTQIELARKTASLEVVESLAKALNVSYERLFKSDVSEKKDMAFSLHVLENDLINLVSDSIHEKFQNLAID
ncbi:MAG: hypothetical protein ILP07_00560 [Treponema sp.]|nr:hypothetical protein [Treponema sp.]